MAYSVCVARMYACLSVCMCARVYVCVYVYVCMQDCSHRYAWVDGCVHYCQYVCDAVRAPVSMVVCMHVGAIMGPCIVACGCMPVPMPV